MKETIKKELKIAAVFALWAFATTAYVDLCYINSDFDKVKIAAKRLNKDFKKNRFTFLSFFDLNFTDNQYALESQHDVINVRFYQLQKRLKDSPKKSAIIAFFMLIPFAIARNYQYNLSSKKD